MPLVCWGQAGERGTGSQVGPEFLASCTMKRYRQLAEKQHIRLCLREEREGRAVPITKITNLLFKDSVSTWLYNTYK